MQAQAGTKRAGEKLEIQSKKIVKETKNENLREINQKRMKKNFMEQIALQEEKSRIDEHTRRLLQSRERQAIAKR